MTAELQKRLTPEQLASPLKPIQESNQKELSEIELMKLEDRGIKPNVKKTIKEIAFEDPEVGRHVQQAYRIALDAVDKRIKNCDEAHDVEYMDDKERANYYERVRQQNKKSDL